MSGTDTLASHEELGPILWSSVRYGPFPILYTESWLLLLTVLTICCGLRLGFFTFFSLFSWLLLRNMNDLWLFENFILNLVLLCILLLGLKLEPDNSLYLPNVLLDHEQFIHESEL